jgi:hypothetical protein
MEAAVVVAFLALNEVSYVKGVVLPVDRPCAWVKIISGLSD